MPSYPSTQIVDGRTTVAVAGTAEQLSTTSIACKEVIIQAELDNTGVIVVGDDTVVATVLTRRGIALNAGAVLILDVADANLVWLDTTVNGDGVTYMVLRGE